MKRIITLAALLSCVMLPAHAIGDAEKRGKNRALKVLREYACLVSVNPDLRKTELAIEQYLQKDPNSTSTLNLLMHCYSI